MLRRDALALALLAVPIAARAQTPSQQAMTFLQEIYDPYRKPDFKGQPYWETKRFFVTDLAEAIDRDFAEAKKRKEVPTLDGDPFIDAQDWNIGGGFSYAVSATKSGDHAAAAIAFENLGKPTLVALFLVRTPQGWRINDIVTRGSSLRALYKLH